MTSSELWDAIYLSPHLDDAALSCGGQIAARARAGETILVLTLFTADEPAPPYSQLASKLHELFDLEAGVVAHRRAEDLEACRKLGAEVRHADLPEAIYRRDGAGGFLCNSFADLFAAPSAADHSTLDALCGIIEALPPTEQVISPLGVGGHVDHRLTRTAAEMASRDLSYYEEIPYAEKWLALRRTLGHRADWEHQVVPFEEVDLEAKIAACSAYASQIEGLYKTPQRLDRALRRRFRNLGGERLWRRV